MQNKPSRKELITRVLLLIKPCWFYAGVNLLLALVNVACVLYVPILIGRAIDFIISAGNVDIKAVIEILVKVAVFVMVAALSQYCMSLVSNKLSFLIVRDLRKQVFEHIWHLPLSYIDSHPAGDIISRVISDADQFADGLLMGFTQLFSGLATILGTLCFMFSLDYRVTLVVIIVTPLSFLVAKYIATHTYDMFKAQSTLRGKQTSQIEECLSQVKVIRAFNKEDEMIDKFCDLNDELQKVSLSAVFYSSLTNPCTRFVNSLVYALVALAGALIVISGGMTVGVWSCFLNYANQYTKPFNEISGVITELQGAFACVARIFELLDEPFEIEDSNGDNKIDSITGDISIQSVDFSYDKNNPFIENLNLEVTRGQKVAIVGPTGCGKTTLINLLMRFYDVDEGSIKIDGRDIRDISRESLRASVGMVLQDTWLRNGTIADNIRLAKPSVTMEEVVNAAKEAHAHSFIRRLENGYDTLVNEDGGSLSAGQKQLLCIARIMLILPPMLILDEATSSIDTRTEIKIQNAFAKLMENKTSFIVAHRLSTIVNSDIILVMKAGKIIEKGTHSELIALKGFYYSLYNAGINEGTSD